MNSLSKICCIVLLFCASDLVTETHAEPIRVVAFGDSTTAQRGKLKVYCDQLRTLFEQVEQEIEIVNSGVGGNHTDLALERFDRDVLQHAPDVVVMQFGINDAAVDVWKNPPATQPRVSLERYSRNLSEFVEQLQARKIHVILMTPNPLRWTEKLKQHYGKLPYCPDDLDGLNVLLTEYSAAVRQIAVREDVILVDVDRAFRAFDKQPGQSMDALLLDGMHPNEHGHALIANLLFPELKRRAAPKR